MNNQSSSFGPKKDAEFMQKAMLQARRAFDYNEVPIGALVVNAEGKTIARAYNQVMKRKTQSAHAEILAIEKAGKKQGDWRLEGCWIYVTLEPCLMCINLIQMSRLEGVVYGARSPLFGCHLDNITPLRLYRKVAVKMVQGVGSREAINILRRFFQKRRKKR